MTMSSETRLAVARVEQRLAEMARDVASLRRGTRTAQLPLSSLETGEGIDMVDADTGEVRGRIGWQPDGSVGLVTDGGEAPGAVSAPVGASRLAGALITWDGLMADPDALPPSDLAQVQVHASTTPGFVWGPETRASSIPRGGGSTVLGPLVAGTPVYVVLVGVTTGGVVGAVSAEISVVPTSVVDGFPPGGIPGTLIADDSIDTPHLRANSVTALQMAVASVLADAIAAGQITADKLAAILVVANRIIAGTDGGARTELNEFGLFLYDADENTTVVFDGTTGSAAFTGDITGSDIRGGRILLGDFPNSGSRLLLSSSAPVPGDFYQLLVASASGSDVYMRADDTSALMSIQPPDEPGYGWASGSMYGFVAVAGSVRWPALAFVGPSQIGHSHPEIQLEGETSTRDTSQVKYRADHHVYELGALTPNANGSVEVREELSVRAPAHMYTTVDMVAQPTGSGNNGVWTDFTSGQYPRPTWRTGWSGRVRVTIVFCGINVQTGGATLSVGFRLTGGSTLAADLTRAAMVRSRQFAATTNTYAVQQTAVVYLQLAGDADYTLIPAWRASGSSLSWGTAGDSPLKMDLAYANSITVENLM